MRFQTVSHWSLISLSFKLSGDNVTVNVKKKVRLGIGWAQSYFLSCLLVIGYSGFPLSLENFLFMI